MFKIQKNFFAVVVLFLYFGLFSTVFAQQNFNQRIGESCANDTECASGLRCNLATGGFCETKFVPPHSVSNGSVCGSDLECKEGSICVNSGSTKICQYDGQNSASTCTKNSDCGVGKYCESRQCLNVVEGVSCQTDASVCQTSKTGLSCDSNTKKCTAFPTAPSLNNQNSDTPYLPTGTPIPPDSKWCNNDPNLVYQNGICLPKSAQDCSKDSLACTSSLTEGIVKIIKLLLTLSGMISVLFLIVGGFWYMTSAGNEEQAEKGKNTITNFFMGLVIILMAYAIVTIVNNLVTQAK